MPIPTMSAGSDSELIAEALDEAGCVVVTGLLDESARNSVSAELAPYMESVRVVQEDEDDPARFYPGRTRRTSALVARSASVGKLVVDSRSLDLCDRFLTPTASMATNCM